MTGIIFVILQVLIMVFCTTTPAANALDTTNAETGLNLTISEILALFTFIGGLFGVWLDARLRIKSLEIRLKAQEKGLADHNSDNKVDLKDLEAAVLKQGEQAQKDMRELTSRISELHLIIVQNLKK